MAWVVVLLVAGILIAAWGGHHGDWHWLVTPTVAATAIGVALLFGQRMDDHAVSALWVGHAVVAIMLLASIA